MSRHPEKIGKYHIVGEAGRGNMGVVYTGHDPFSDRRVAVKVLSSLDRGDDAARRLARRMFFNEAHTAGVLDHPHILKVLDAGEDAGVPYLVMEHVEGGRTVLPHCRPEGLLPVNEVVAIAQRCASALDYAHRRGVVHRDIKPSNLLLTGSGVKLGDFGIAQRLREDATATDGLMGSPRYMSPEQVRELPLTGQSDVYALGVVMYELLTGHPPFSGSNLAALFNQIQHAPPPPLRDRRPGLPEALESIVCCALEKDPGFRYQSAAELASDLAALAQQTEAAQDQRAGTEPDAGRSSGPRSARLRALPFFNEFADAELDELQRAAAWRELRSGETLPAPPAGAPQLLLVVYGDVELATRAGIAGLLGPGDCFGDVEGATREMLLRARNDAAVLSLAPERLSRLTEGTRSRFLTHFINALVSRLARRPGRGPSSGMDHGSTH